METMDIIGIFLFFYTLYCVDNGFSEMLVTRTQWVIIEEASEKPELTLPILRSIKLEFFLLT